MKKKNCCRLLSQSKLSLACLSALISLSSIESAAASETIVIDTPNGKPFIALDINGDPLSELQTEQIKMGLSYWASLLESGLQNSKPKEIYLTNYHTEDFQAEGVSNPLPSDDPYASMTELAAFLQFGHEYDGENPDTMINLYGTSDVWSKSTVFSPLTQGGGKPELAAVLLHEFAHALGMAFPIEDEIDHTTEFFFMDVLGPWESGLRDAQGEAPQAGMPVQLISSGDTPTEGIFDVVDSYYASGVYFTGEHVQEVLDGALISCYDLTGEPAPGLPVNGYEYAGEYEGQNYYYPELSHIELQNSLLSHQNFRNWSTMMEAEIALFQDLGYKIDRKNWFGYSVYGSGPSLQNPNVIVNSTPFYARNAEGTDWLEGVANANPWGIGLHIYGSFNDVTQAADILSVGSTAIGIRLEGYGNMLRIPESTLVRSDGDHGYGFAVTYGSGHTIIQEGVVTAMGQNGVAALFSFGDNLIGNNIEIRGSYIYDSFGESYDPSLLGLADALVDRYDLSGTLVGRSAAIFIDDNALVRNINVLKGAQIAGDIISLWDPTAEPVQADQVELSELVTNLRFGLAADDRGAALAAPDPTFSLYYDGSISAGTDESGQLLPATIALSIEGGTLIYDGSASVLSVTVQNGATLAGNGNYAVSDIECELEQCAEDRLEGLFLNKGTISPGGNRLGSITINGAFEQSEDGALLLEFDSQSKTDSLVFISADSEIQIGGSVEIAPTKDYYPGGTLSFSLKDMIQSEKELSLDKALISFVDISERSPIFFATANVDGDLVKYTLERRPGAYTNHAQSAQGAEVADVFDKHAGHISADMRELVAALDFSNPDGSVLPGAFEQLSPELYGRAGSAAISAQRIVSNALISSWLDLQGSNGQFSNAKGNDRAFMIPLGGYSSQQRNGFRSRYAGLIGGVEKGVDLDSGHLSVGVHAAALTRKDKFIGAEVGQNESESLTLGLHGRYDFADVQGLYTFGYWQASVDNADLSRQVSFEGYFDNLKSDWTGWATSLGLGLGRTFELSDTVSFSPVWYFDYTLAYRPDVDEHSVHGAALKVNDQTYDSLRSSLGVKLEAALPFEGIESRVAASLWWNHEFFDDYGRTEAAFKACGDTKFGAVESVQARDTATAAISVKSRLGDDWVASIGAGADFGDGTHGAWGNVRLDWRF